MRFSTPANELSLLIILCGARRDGTHFMAPRTRSRRAPHVGQSAGSGRSSTGADQTPVSTAVSHAGFSAGSVASASAFFLPPSFPPFFFGGIRCCHREQEDRKCPASHQLWLLLG